jgi:hypothetical protein
MILNNFSSVKVMMTGDCEENIKISSKNPLFEGTWHEYCSLSLSLSLS